MKHLDIITPLLALLGLCAATAVVARDYAPGRDNFSPPAAVDNLEGQHAHWRGIGRLQMHSEQPDASCTASLLDSRSGGSDASGPAYILTSGHCVTRDALNIAADMPLNGHVAFDYFVGSLDDSQRFPLKKVVGASMRGVDLAIIELEAPLKALLDAGIEPVSLATEPPPAGSDLMIVGNPAGHADNPGLRLSLCPLDGTVDLLEEVYVFRGAQKNRCLGIAPGSSGSPVLERQSNRVIGVLGTTTSGTREESRCHAHTPCEVQDGQAVWSPETSYSSPAMALARCFSQGVFDPSDTHCSLQPTLRVEPGATPAPLPFARIVRDDSGQDILPSWSWSFALDMPFYRYKTVRQPSDCESPHYYSDAIDSTDALIDIPVGPEPGLHQLCIIGVNSQQQSPTWEMMKKPVIVSMELAPAAPSRMPWLSIKRMGQDYSVTPLYAEPFFVMYEFKWGEPEQTDCNDPQGYQEEETEPLHFTVERLPIKLCSKVYEMSMQPSAPREDVLTP